VAGALTDSDAAAQMLSTAWGLPVRTGTVSLQRRYDGTEFRAEIDGVVAAELVALNPDPLSPGDVQYTVTMTLAGTPRGLRLIQVEPEYDLRRVERVNPRLVQFDGAAWGQPLLTPRHPVSATIGVGNVSVPKLRYVCRPDVMAFEGTEPV
jgi:hypothetical protein